MDADGEVLVGVRGTIARRAGWGLADQAFSSLTNFALGLMVARAVAADDFGAFSLAFATYLLAMGLVRAVVAQPLIIRYSTATADEWRRGTAEGTGAAVVIGIAAAAIAVVVGLVGSGAFGHAFLALAITFPGLLVQDCWRFAFLAKGEPKSAFANDALWALVLFPLLIVLAATDSVSVFAATLVWGGSATLAAVFGIVQSKAMPRPSKARRWWREHRDITPAYIGEFGATAGSSQAAMFGIGLVADLVVVAALRAAEILMGPLKTVAQGLRMVAQPEAVRSLARGGDLLRPCLLFAVAMAALAGVAGAVLLILPDSVGRAVLGDTWEPAQTVLVPYTLSVMAAGLLGGAQLGLHALVAVRRSLVARVAVSVMLVVFKISGAVIAGAPGAAAGGAVAMWAGATLWWWQLLQARREHVSATGAGSGVQGDTLNADLLNP